MFGNRNKIVSGEIFRKKLDFSNSDLNTNIKIMIMILTMVIIIITIIIIIITVIIIIISSFKCYFDTIISQTFNLRPKVDEGLYASLYRYYVLD